MDDYGHQLADESIARLERELAKVYRQAEREMRGKQRAQLKAFADENAKWAKSLDGSQEAKRKYKAWLSEQAMRIGWSSDMIDALADAAVNANVKAAQMIADTLPMVYAQNANWAAFTVDKGIGFDTAFTLVSEDAIRHLLTTGDPIVKEVTIPKVDRARDYRYNRQKFHSAITQGIVQGESIPNIVKRTRSIFGSNLAAATRAARTATTCAENAGRLYSYQRAESIGIQLKEEWMATLDSRTRESHMQLDGEKVDVGGTFSNGCRYPGDSNGPAEEVYNCRCTTVAVIEEVDYSQADRWSRLPDGITYEEWLEG